MHTSVCLWLTRSDDREKNVMAVVNVYLPCLQSGASDAAVTSLRNDNTAEVEYWRCASRSSLVSGLTVAFTRERQRRVRLVVPFVVSCRTAQSKSKTNVKFRHVTQIEIRDRSKFDRRTAMKMRRAAIVQTASLFRSVLAATLRFVVN
jgi:hypothetical protein